MPVNSIATVDKNSATFVYHSSNGCHNNIIIENEKFMFSRFWSRHSVQHLVVSRVSTLGRLNVTHDFGLHRCSPGINIPYVCIEAATVVPRNVVHWHLPGSERLPGTLQYLHVYPYR